MSIVKTEGLTKTYGQLEALHEVSLSVPENSIYALVGPNGAGKTTAFEILSTLLMPSAGYVEIDGVDPITEPEEVRRIIGYVPDFFGFYDDITVKEYLEFFAASYRMDPKASAGVIPDLIDLVDLQVKSDTDVESLSRGMKQRLGLARALIHDPELLILDEPASGLDPHARVDLRELLLELQKMGKTILISSHILSELEHVCDHLGVLEAGDLVVQGSPKEMVAVGEDSRVFRMRLTSGYEAEDVAKALDSHPSVRATTLDGDSCEMVIEGGDDEVARILSSVVSRGTKVIGFTEQQEGLEELFLRLTKGLIR